MKQFQLVLAFLMATSSSFAQNVQNNLRPKLVVGIVIDQMRWDYLYRFQNGYGANGFNRLLNQGFSCNQTMINYLPTFTGPGHACIYTGSVPAIHGIVANDWKDNNTGKKTYCVEDVTEYELNMGAKRGKSMSPRNLLTTTITDELRLATNFRSRVYGVSVKDRGSILPAGHMANGAYWLDDSMGNFCTSTYYDNSNPTWLQQFNNRHLSDSLLNLGWQLMDPTKKIYTESLADDNGYEGNYKGALSPIFPHTFSHLTGKDRIKALKSSPAGNTITLAAAKACLEGEALGLGNTSDFLCVSLSSTDYVGHQFAPNSLEIEDTYLRLDQELAAFLTYLDQKLGKGNYLLFLTADHGAAHNSQFLMDRNVPAGYVSKDLGKEANAYLKSAIGADSVVASFSNYQFYFNDSQIVKANYDKTQVRSVLVNWLKSKPEIAFVIEFDHMERCLLPEPIYSSVINGYNKARSGSIQIIPNPGWFEGEGKTGTTHGTWNPYDAHIPLLWYGWHIPKGATSQLVNMTDISATLAALLHIQMPNGCIGKPIVEITK